MQMCLAPLLLGFTQIITILTKTGLKRLKQYSHQIHSIVAVGIYFLIPQKTRHKAAVRTFLTHVRKHVEFRVKRIYQFQYFAVLK